MKRPLSWVVVAAVSLGVLLPYSAQAISLKVAPLEYRASLKENERKQGVVDVSNPAPVAVTVAVSVQAFRQIDNDGGLQFYDDKQVATGVKPELSNFELGPREALRLYFTIDGRSLPAGDVYAGIFFTTAPRQAQNGVGQSVRVGTLLSLVNKAPGSRAADVTGLNLPLLQLGETVKGDYRVKNTGPDGSGFYPAVTVSSWPGDETKRIESSLVFGGRERSNDLALKTGYGIHRVAVAYGDSMKSRWVVMVAPWMVITGSLVVLIVVVELWLLKRRRNMPSKVSITTGR